MQIFPLLFAVTQSEQFDRLQSPPASGASYSSVYRNFASSAVLPDSNIGQGSIIDDCEIKGGIGSGGSVTVRAGPITVAAGSPVGIGSGSGGVINQQYSSVRHLTERVPIPVPQPYPVTINRPVSVPVPVPKPVDVPRPVPVSVPQPLPVPISKPVPVPITRPVPIPIQRPFYVRIPQPVQVPYPQPYPVEVSQPYPVDLPGTFPLIESGLIGGNIIGGGIGVGIPNIIGGGLSAFQSSIGGFEGIPQYGDGFRSGYVDQSLLLHSGNVFGGDIGGESVFGGGIISGNSFGESTGFINSGSDSYGGHSLTGENVGGGQLHNGKTK